MSFNRGILYLVLILLMVGCDSTEPTDGRIISLEAVDASCTEAWLNVALQNVPLPAKTILTRNDSLIGEFNLFTSDTVIIDEGLNPSTNYNFKLSLANGSINSVTSIRTMDTTNHKFTWQTFSFGGQGGSSTLYDVAIIDENNIWAVGEIYTADGKYNAVHWDGSEWVLLTVNYGGYFWSIRSVFAFNENDIWFSAYVKFDGERFIDLPIPEELTGWGINETWGGSSSNFYVVGNGGNIAHYNGNSWSKIESGTTTIVTDIWGFVDKQNEIISYCTVSSFFVPGDKKILKIKNGNVETVKWNENARLYSIWAKNENILYVCGEGVFEHKFGVWKKVELLSISTNSIRGNDLNDIFVVGDYGLIYHFNGLSWQLMSSINSDKGYSEVSTFKNIVAICGNQQGRGIIEIGRRN